MTLQTIRQQLNLGIPLTRINLRVTYYSRVSTDHLEQTKSLKNQIEHFDEMIKNNPNWTYIKGYVDNGISGTTDYKRDHFMQMINDARNNKFDLIITKEISRFSRNTLDSIKYTRELLSYGVAVLFVNDNINTALPDSELRLTIMASMAQDEIRRLSERVKFGMNRSIKKGNILGNNLLYGYKKDKNTGHLIIVPSKALIVKRIFREYAIDHHSLSKIAKELNEENIKTAQNKKWSSTTISRMIQNIKYKGYYCGKKSEIIDYMTKKVHYLPTTDWLIYEDKEKIPPIIDDELWQRANQILNAKTKSFKKITHNKKAYQNRYLLSAKIYCSKDHETFHRRQQCKASKDITWVCAKYLKEGKQVCSSPNLRESELYTIFNHIIHSLNLKLEKIVTILSDLYLNNKKKTPINNEIEKLKVSKNNLIKKKEKLLELNIAGLITNQEFFQRNQHYNQDLNKIEDQITKSKNITQNFLQISENHQKLKTLINSQIKQTSTIEKIIALLLDKIIVSKINDDNQNLVLDIYFNLSQKYVQSKDFHNINLVDKNTINFITQEFIFKRGYNTKGTKRYNIKYKVNCLVTK